MDLAIILGLMAFVLVVGVIALLGVQTKHEIKDDPVTQDVIVRATTGPVVLNFEHGATAASEASTPVNDARESRPNETLPR
jgi:hypothetical protein